MPRFLWIPILSWITVSLLTLGPGWLIVRFLPLWASIPLVILLVLLLTIVGVFSVVASVPGDSSVLKYTSRIYGVLLALVIGSPGVIAAWLFKVVG